MSIRKDDEVRVVRGKYKNTEGKVTAVYRKKYVVHVEKCTRDKANGQTIPVGIDASNLEITKLKMDKCRKAIVDRKNRVKIGHSKGAVTSSLHDNMAGVD
jgi:ribosomal protein uL24